MTQIASPVNPVPEGKSNGNPLRVLQNRAYALYFGGQLISQAGTWMQQIAVSWLTYKLTNSPMLLAVVAVSSMLPSLLVMPFAGVVSDRFNRHRIVIITQAVAMCQATVLAYLTLTHQVQIWQLISLELVIGLVNAFDMPVRSAFVMDMVKNREDVPATIAMNSSLMNVSRLVGPAIAGFLVASVGEGVCFAINAASYIAVIGALMCIKGNFAPKPGVHGSVLGEFMDGVKYAKSVSAIRGPILLLAAFGFGGMAYAQLMPVFVHKLGGDANTLGYLSSASAFGSVLGTAILATRKRVAGLGKWISGASFVYACSVLLLSQVHIFWLAVPVLVMTGASMMLQMGCCNTILQSVVEPDKRGRVMSLFTLAFMGTVPLGSLCAGWAASHIGFSNTVAICGAYCLVVATIFLSQLPKLRRESHDLYVERGLIAAPVNYEAIEEETVDRVFKPNG